MLWTIERNRALREMIDAGLHPKEMAKKLGCSFTAIRAKLRHKDKLDIVEQVHELWQSGLGSHRISRQLKIPLTRVISIIGCLGLKRPPEKVWTPEQDRMLLNLTEDTKLTYNEIAEQIGFHPATIQQKAKKLGIDRSKFMRQVSSIGGWEFEKIEELVRLFHAGESAAKMAEALGTTRNAVIGKLNRLGLRRRARHIKEIKAVSENRTANKTQPARELPVETSECATPFLETRPNQCKWPIEGEGLRMICCGQEVVDKYPYCEAHKSRAFRRTKELAYDWAA